MRSVPVLACAAVMASGLTAHAQFFERMFNPDVQVTLLHPPGLGMKVKRVAFAPVMDRASEDLVSACIASLLQSSDLEVLDRANIEKVLKEQKFGSSGLVDEATAVELGRLLGSPVLLVVKVHRDEVRHTPLTEKKEGGKDKDGKVLPPVITYISKTQVEFNASVQVLDLATGRVYTQQRMVATPSQENRAKDSKPEFPSDGAVRELAIQEATTQVVRMLLPWTERRKLIFYDDSEYGMKDAYRRLKAEDAAGALAKSREALAAAKADPKGKPKFLGRTLYNLGMCHFILGQQEEALGFLRAARETDLDLGIYKEALAECERALQLAQAMRQVDARSGITPPAKGAEPPAGNGAEERLRRLEDLKRKGLLTEEEYRTKRAEILKEL